MRYTTLITHSLRKAAGVLMMLLLLAAQVGCRAVYEEWDAPLAVDANLRIVFAVPSETRSTTTQSYDDPANQEGMDNAINPLDLEVYFFTEDGEFVTSVSGSRNVEVSPYSSAGYDPHYHMYSVGLRVTGVTNGQRCRVVVVANKRSTHATALPFCVLKNDNWLKEGVGSTDEEKLYNSLTFNFSNLGSDPVQDYVRWNWQMKTPGCVPMWGFNTMNLKLATINQYGYHDPVEPSGQIDLLRSIAKVKIAVNSELLEFVHVTDFDKTRQKGGVRLHSRMKDGYMAPSYSKVGSLTSTPNIIHKDKIGGVPGGAYTNEWINEGTSYPSTERVYPFFLSSDGCYYIYLPEHEIGDAWMHIEFKWSDPSFPVPITHDYKLLFADYEAAMVHAGTKDVAFTEKQLESYRFPVMRNHYYEYTVTSLNPIFVKFEVCEWQYKSTDIEFN